MQDILTRKRKAKHVKCRPKAIMLLPSITVISASRSILVVSRHITEPERMRLIQPALILVVMNAFNGISKLEKN